jgi:hypothetical protein
VGTALILDAPAPEDVASVRYTVTVDDEEVFSQDERP